MYYIRKLTKTSSLNKIKSANTFEDTESDVLKDEFKTSSSRLSFWKCEDLNNYTETINAILFSGSDIKASSFIALSDKDLNDIGVVTDDSALGKTGYKGHGNLHIDLCLPHIQQIKDLMGLYHKMPTVFLTLEKPDVQKYIKNVIAAGNYDENNTDEHLKKEIQKLQEKSFPRI